MNGRATRAFPVEEFVQQLSAQLDRAQDMLALKARTGRPLTFALKDMAIDLRVFWEVDPSGRALIRHAGPNEEGASTVKLSFTTITRNMVEENTLSMSHEEDPRGLEDLRGSQLADDDRRRLELAGVRTVGQLKRMSQGTDPKSMEAYLGIPVMRLRAALEQAARPVVTGQEVVRSHDGGKLIRIRGANLTDGFPPEVRLAGEMVEVLESSPAEVLVRPMSHHKEGAIEVLTSGQRATGFFRLPFEGPQAAPLAEGGTP